MALWTRSAYNPDTYRTTHPATLNSWLQIQIFCWIWDLNPETVGGITNIA